MGDVFWGLHTPIAARLIDTLGVVNAVETGTHFGFGALQLASMVKRVWTIDSDEKLIAFCQRTYRQADNVIFLSGESPAVLPAICSELDSATLFVLDAHWFPMSPRASHVPSDQCPLLAELSAIFQHTKQPILAASAMIVDDAQMFLGSLKRPFVRSSLPSIVDVLEALGKMFAESWVTDDLIVAGPTILKAPIDAYLKDRDDLGFP